MYQGWIRIKKYEIFGILDKNINASLPLDMLPEAKYNILFSATVCSNLTIVQNEKTGYKVSLDKIIDVIYKSVSFNPELLKAIEILDQVTELQETILSNNRFGLRFASCLTKYSDWNNRKTLQLHALSILYKLFHQVDVNQRYSIVENGLISKVFKLMLNNQNFDVCSKAALLLGYTANFNFNFDVRVYVNVNEVIERLVQLIKKKPNIECLISLIKSFNKFLSILKPNEFDLYYEILKEVVPDVKYMLFNSSDEEILSNALDCFFNFSNKENNNNEKLIQIIISKGINFIFYLKLKIRDFHT